MLISDLILVYHLKVNNSSKAIQSQASKKTKTSQTGKALLKGMIGWLYSAQPGPRDATHACLVGCMVQKAPRSLALSCQDSGHLHRAWLTRCRWKRMGTINQLLLCDCSGRVWQPNSCLSAARMHAQIQEPIRPVLHEVRLASKSLADRYEPSQQKRKSIRP